MTHANKINWNDFYASGIGPELPLSAEQVKQQKPSGILPSGEANFFDVRQSHNTRYETASSKVVINEEDSTTVRHNGGSSPSGINIPFPYPNLTTQDKYAFPSGQTREDFPDQFSPEWWDASGILKTYGPDGIGLSGKAPIPSKPAHPRQSGIFHFIGDSGRFSASGEFQRKNTELDPFSSEEDPLGRYEQFNRKLTPYLFNPYIHHERGPASLDKKSRKVVKVPYIADYQITVSGLQPYSEQRFSVLPKRAKFNTRGQYILKPTGQKDEDK